MTNPAEDNQAEDNPEAEEFTLNSKRRRSKKEIALERKKKAQKIERQRRRSAALDRKLISLAIMHRMQKPGSPFARGLFRIASRNVTLNLRRLGLN